jgi:LAO/AO transport system kinase
VSFDLADLPAALAGNRRLLARLLTALEDHPDPRLLASIHEARRGAPVIGVTGPPGAGKSSLVDGLVGLLRHRGQRPAVVAVDPTSPFSGGAILGDRIRMQGHAGDEEVFIRSLASRGRLGGIAAAADAHVAVLDAAGFAPVFVETVGVGQSELEVVEVADTLIVVLYPGWGDEVQAAKAGLLEAGDVFCINKADLTDPGDAVRLLEGSVSERDGWHPPVLPVSARSGIGIDELWEAIEGHRRHQAGREGGGDRVRRRRREEYLRAAGELGKARARARSRLVSQVEAGEIDPWSAAAQAVPAGQAVDEEAPESSA